MNSNSTNPNLSILPLHTDKIKKIKKLIFSPTQLKGEIYIIDTRIIYLLRVMLYVYISFKIHLNCL